MIYFTEEDLQDFKENGIPMLSWDFVSYEWIIPYVLGILVFVVIVMTCITAQRVCQQMKGNTKYQKVVFE